MSYALPLLGSMTRCGWFLGEAAGPAGDSECLAQYMPHLCGGATLGMCLHPSRACLHWVQAPSAANQQQHYPLSTKRAAAGDSACLPNKLLFIFLSTSAF